MQSTKVYNKWVEHANYGTMFLLYLKDLQLLQSDLLTLTMFSGQMDGLQHEAWVCRKNNKFYQERKDWNTKSTRKRSTAHTHYLCRWRGRHRCCLLPPLCPPAAYWTCNGRQLWPGGVALPVATHSPNTAKKKIEGMNCIISKCDTLD